MVYFLNPTPLLTSRSSANIRAPPPLFPQQLKAICIKYMQEYVAAFQERRSKATPEVVAQFMALRPLTWRGNPKAPYTHDLSSATAGLSVQDGAGGAGAGETGADGKLTKNAQKKLEKERQIAAKKAAKAAAKSGDGEAPAE